MQAGDTRATLEPFRDRVQRLATERGLSTTQVGYLAYSDQQNGTSPSTFQKALRGERPLTISLVEAVADTLGVSPEEFHEYRLAVARRQLDEREVGLEQAIDMLEAVERALRRG